MLGTAAVLGAMLLAAIPLTYWATSRAPAEPPATRVHPADDAHDSAPMEGAVTTTSAPPPTSPTLSPAPTTELIAFYGNFDDNGYASLASNAPDIDVLMPMWYHLGSDGRLTFDDSHAERVRRIIRTEHPDMKVMPIVNNYDKATESWNAEAVGELIADPATRTVLAQRIVGTLAAAGYDGVNIDFEGFKEKDRANLVAFMAELYPLAKAAGLEVSMDVIVRSKTYDHVALAKHVDYLIPMLYDQHWKTSPAGPISSVPWFEGALQYFLNQVPAGKVVIGMGTYSYDWSDAGGRAKSLTHASATALAAEYGVPIGLAAPDLNSTFAYTDKAGTGHSVWMLDSVSAFNQLSVASKYRVRGYAVWRLGAEDPALWRVLPNRDALDRAVAESLDAGSRSIVYDAERSLITSGQVVP